MLRKKYTMQKSLRLDAQLSEDLETLSKVLERPQNELINIAIEKLIMENRKWFAHSIVADHFKRGIEERREHLELFKMQELFVSVGYDDSYAKMVVRVKTKHKTMEREFTDDDKLEQFLLSLSQYLDLDTLEIEEYLDKRLDYR